MKHGNDAENFLAGRPPEGVLLDWFNEAKTCGLKYPDALTLSTRGADGFPASRTVLCKEIRDGRVLFYTNYKSAKGLEIEQDPHVAIHFYWDPLFRQIKMKGTVCKTSRKDSEDYWRTRPRGSQLSQTASLQSQILGSRNQMEQIIAVLEKKFANTEIPCPENWGGYEFTMTYVEFWIGQTNRFHDRFAYHKVENKWSGQRLYP